MKRNSICFCFVFILFIGFSGIHAGNKFYVDNQVSGITNNGLSWATAWKKLGDISGVNAGDTVFISGGKVSQTYTDLMYTSQGGTMWLPVGGTAGKPVTYMVGQDAAHNGMVVFDGAGTQNWIFGGSWVTINGNVMGEQQIKVINFNEAVVGDNDSGFVLRYTNITGQLRFLNVDQVELDHLYINPQTGIDGAIRIDGTGGDYNSNSIHDCTVNVYYQHDVNAQGGNGDDGIQGGAFCTISNNIIRGVLVSNYVGNQHQDGIQALTPEFIRITGNYFENLANYSVYLEYFGTSANAQAWNNVINYSDTILSSQPSCGVCIGGDPGDTGTISNVIVANNTVIGGNRGISLEGGNKNVSYANSHVVNNLTYRCSSSIETYGWSGITYLNNNTSNSAEIFVNVPGNDFHLTSGMSGFIDAGSNWPATYFKDDKDAVLRPQGLAWDIGAYEFIPLTGILPAGPVSAKAFSIYPNPAGDKIYLDISGANSAIVSVFSLDGKMVIKKTLNFPTLNSINVSGLEPGIYFIQFSSNDSESNNDLKATKKLVIVR